MRPGGRIAQLCSQPAMTPAELRRQRKQVGSNLLGSKFLIFVFVGLGSPLRSWSLDGRVLGLLFGIEVGWLKVQISFTDVWASFARASVEIVESIGLVLGRSVGASSEVPPRRSGLRGSSCASRG